MKMFENTNYCKLINFQSNPPSVVIFNFIKTDQIFDIFAITRLLCTEYLKNNRIRNKIKTFHAAFWTNFGPHTIKN